MGMVRFINICFLSMLCIDGISQPAYDIIIRNGIIYDGTGSPPTISDVAIRADTIAGIGSLGSARAKKEIDATGLAVAPGFINMLSWAGETLTHDGRSMSDLKQGVTLEVFGEGWSPAPRINSTRDKRWQTMNEYFSYIEKRGVSVNVASFVGATSVRSYVLGQANRAPNSTELIKDRKSVV